MTQDTISPIDLAAPEGDLTEKNPDYMPGDETANWIADLPAVADLPLETITAQPKRPTDGEIIEVLAVHYEVSEDTVTSWLKGLDL